MSESTQEAALPSEAQEAALPSEASAIKHGVDWVAKHWPRVRLGHEGMMLEKIQRQNRIVEITARNTMTGKVDDVADWPSSEGEKMGVEIGDHVTHNHYYDKQMALAALAGKDVAEQSAPKKAPGILAKAAIVVALAGSGGAAGVAIPWLMGMFDKPPPPSVPAAVDYSDGYMEVEKWERPQ